MRLKLTTLNGTSRVLVVDERGYVYNARTQAPIDSAPSVFVSFGAQDQTPDFALEVEVLEEP